MNELLSNLLLAVVIAVILMITRYGIPALKQVAEGTKLEAVMKYACEFVKAAEQTMSALTGAERKSWVTEILKGILTAKNICLTDKQLDAIIEAAVFDMNKGKTKKEELANDEGNANGSN